MRAQGLIHRDMALASFVGAIGSGASHEGTADFGDEFGAEDDSYEPSFGEEVDFDPSFGADFGYDFGSDFGKAAPVKRSPAAAQKAWKAARTMARGTQLFPNKGSAIDVERYVFTMSEPIVLGTAEATMLITDTPDTKIRPQRVTMNSPCPMFAYMTSLRVANVNVSVGNGVEDTFNYSAQGQGMSLDLPTLNPSNRAKFAGSYTGFTPPGYNGGDAAFFSVSFRGPATLAAG